MSGSFPIRCAVAVFRADELLRRAREASDLTQGGTRQSAISQIERGEVQPTLSRLRSLVHLTGRELQIGVRPRRLRIDEGLFFGQSAHVSRGAEAAITMSRYALALRAAGQRAELDRIERLYAEPPEPASL